MFFGEKKVPTTTADSSRAWIFRRPGKLSRYLRKSHRREDRENVFNLLFHAYPDEGKKLIENFNLPDYIKKEMFLKWIVHQPQISCGVFSDQRMGKDATLNKIFDDSINYCNEIKIIPPRIVTLGNIRKPPVVDDKDMYFSFRKIPSGKKNHEVWIYSSEIECLLPARETQGPENKLFSQLEGTMAQNHQKLFGCSKLASKVDLNFIRGMNAKIFKFISPEKLSIEGVERVNIISELGRWLLPKDVNDKRKTLLSFDNQLFTLNFDLPEWWSEEYSEQFRDVPMEKVYDYIDSIMFDTEKITASQINVIQTSIAQKFRKDISKEDIFKYLQVGTKTGTI
jgi:hypothetical protein